MGMVTKSRKLDVVFFVRIRLAAKKPYNVFVITQIRSSSTRAGSLSWCFYFSSYMQHDKCHDLVCSADHADAVHTQGKRLLMNHPLPKITQFKLFLPLSNRTLSPLI